MQLRRMFAGITIKSLEWVEVVDLILRVGSGSRLQKNYVHILNNIVLCTELFSSQDDHQD